MTTGEHQAELEARREKLGGRSERLWAKGEFRDFDVYRVPIALLRLNPRNRRFRAEREAFERELGRPIDPVARPKDERSIISLLLDDDVHFSGEELVGTEGKAARDLRADWDRRKQERPLWVRDDGFVSNGNRRLAMLKRLSQGPGGEAYAYVDVIFLPYEDYDDDELFEMEAREQLTQGLKVRYTDLNLLLTLKEAAEHHSVDWADPRSIDRVAQHIQHLVSNLTYGRVQLHAVRYMTEFLGYIDRPGEYRMLDGMVERFRDIGKNMTWAARHDQRHAPDLLELMFSAVQVGAKHGDLRQLRRMLEQDPERFEALVREVRGIEDAADLDTLPGPDTRPDAALSGGEEDTDPDLDPDEAEADSSEDEEADRDMSRRPTLRGYPVTEVRRAVTLAVRSTQESDNADAHHHIRSASDALDRVDPAELPGLLAEPEGHRLREAIEAISAWSEEATEAITREP